MKKKNLYIALVCLSLMSLDALAQKNRTYDGPNKMNTWSITGYGGITKFFGDLKEYDFKRGDHEDLTGSWGLSINKQLSPIFGIQLTGYNGWLKDLKKVFRSQIQEIQVLQILTTLILIVHLSFRFLLMEQ